MLSGSYRNYTPDHYVFGYLMMNHLRSTEQHRCGPKSSERCHQAITFNPVNHSLRKETGLTKTEAV
ncbi:MAG: hypothetical protein MZV63_31600 [Marinilabiliales bacterium]|nr:hypothetical protein [Marinilabiliales bacterium]